MTLPFREVQDVIPSYSRRRLASSNEAEYRGPTESCVCQSFSPQQKPARFRGLRPDATHAMPHPTPRDELTRALNAAARGDASARGELFALVYAQLQRHARREMAGDGSRTLQPTALVHEAWLRVVDGVPDDGWASRAHFFDAAGTAMRRILVEEARRRRRLKRGGDRRRVPLDGVDLMASAPNGEEVLDVDAALTELARLDARLARVVELRFYAGLSMAEVAETIGTSLRTAENLWYRARAWLQQRCDGRRQDGATGEVSEAGGDGI